MNPNTEISNLPLWSARKLSRASPFQEVWYLKMNDPTSNKALWLRFTLLQSKNGFKRIAETWAIFFQKKDTREIQKIAVKQSHDLSSFKEIKTENLNGIQIGESELFDSKTQGKIKSKGNEISWDLEMSPSIPLGRFNLVPHILNKVGIVKNTAWTPFEDLRFKGVCDINGETHHWENAPGMQGHLSGPKNGHSWIWGHCNSFLESDGSHSPVVFEGLTGKASLAGLIPTPALSTFYFYYQGKEYHINSLWSAIRARSKHSLTDWSFEVESGELLFKGYIKADLRSFAGITYEDTNGSLLYCANSKLSEMSLLIYRNGKCEATLLSKASAAFEIVSRDKNQYVQFLL